MLQISLKTTRSIFVREYYDRPTCKFPTSNALTRNPDARPHAPKLLDDCCIADRISVCRRGSRSDN